MHAKAAFISATLQPLVVFIGLALMVCPFSALGEETIPAVALEASGDEAPVFSPAVENPEELRGWFYDPASQIYTYMLWKADGFYEVMNARKGGEELNRRAIPAEKTDQITQLIADVDRATYGGATEGHAWSYSEETKRFKEDLAAILPA